MLLHRSSGILLHITSLPSRHGIGDLGPEAYAFADFLVEAGQKVWQVLPLTPVEEGLGNSPYSSRSVFAGNTLMISLEKLMEAGLLEAEDVYTHPAFTEDQVSYETVRTFKERIFDKAFDTFKAQSRDKFQSYEVFCWESSLWLDDFALYVSLMHSFQSSPWHSWEEGLVHHHPETMQAYHTHLQRAVEKEKFLQYIFYSQWKELKAYCNQKGIEILGDLPIYTDYNSADVWRHQRFFRLNEDKKVGFVAGTPPDYFNENGQIWGLPLYDWEALREEKFEWWVQRLGHNLRLFDQIRLDHFLGFVNYFEIPAEETTALLGRWVNAPAEEFFATIFETFPNMPVIAEDLGVISPAVHTFIEKYHLPGMRVLQFAFSGDPAINIYMPENISENSVIYSATHDNNTTKGWWNDDATQEEKHNLGTYLGYEITGETVAYELIRMGMHTRARLAVFPLQDVLNLDAQARMNTPGIGTGNWLWRLRKDQPLHDVALYLKRLTEESHR